MKKKLIDLTGISAIHFMIALLLITYNSDGQERPPFVPVSPEAASLGKYGDIPPSNSTGTMNFNVPLHTIVNRNLQIPIALNYHASGIKVDEMPSWVGCGWALDAGGVITRNVRGLEDDHEIAVRNVGSQLPPQPDSPHDPWITDWAFANRQYLRNIEGGSLDTEPDIFYYNFSGKSGKFFFDENFEPHFIPHQKQFEITEIWRGGTGRINGFVIKDDQGSTFKFGSQSPVSGAYYHGVEYTMTIPEYNIDPSMVATGWYLTSIEMASGEAAILEYNQKYERYNLPLSETLTICLGCPSGPNHPPVKHDISSGYTIINGYSLLRKICSGQTCVEFIPNNQRNDMTDGHKLDSIYVVDNLVKHKKFAFSYEYQSTGPGGRLFLKNLVQHDQFGGVLPYYSFDYYPGIPALNSKGQDYWGYYNGKDGNPSRIPQLENSYPYQYAADRKSDPAYAKAGALQRIVYPTGGSNKLFYEGNDYYDPNNAYAMLQVQQSAQVSPYQTFDQKNFSVSEDNTIVNYSVDFSFPGVNLSQGDTYAEAKLKTASGTVIQQWYIKIPEQSPIVHTGTVSLNSGTYIMTLQLPCDESNICPSNISASFQLSYQTTDYSTKISQKTGGIRVSKVETYDGINTNAISIKKIKYQKEIDGDMVSSGNLLSLPVFLRYVNINVGYQTSQGGGATGEPVGELWVVFHQVYSSNQSALGVNDGSHVAYTQVEVLEEDIQSRNNGKKITWYTLVPREYASQSPFAPVSGDVSYRGGLVDSIAYFRNVEDELELISSEKHKYKYDTLGYSIKALKTLRSSFHREINYDIIGLWSANYEFDWTYYWLLTEWYYEKSVKRYLFDQNGVYTTTEQFTYQGNNHLNPTKIVSSSSNGDTYEKRYFYVPDFNNYLPDGNIGALMANNITGKQLKEQVVVGGKIVGETISLLDANGLLLSQWTADLATPLTVYTHNPAVLFNSGLGYFKGTEISYTSKLVQDYRTSTGTVTSVIWDVHQTNVTATCTAPRENIFHTSFEDDTGTSGGAKTGLKYLNATSFTIPVLDRPSGLNLVMTYWYFDGSWKFQTEVPYNPVISKPGASKYDEIRVYPVGAQMTTYAHRPGIGVASITDPNNNVLYYEYDSFGRLKFSKDSEGNTMTMLQYNYKK